MTTIDFAGGPFSIHSIAPGGGSLWGHVLTRILEGRSRETDPLVSFDDDVDRDSLIREFLLANGPSDLRLCMASEKAASANRNLGTL